MCFGVISFNYAFQMFDIYIYAGQMQDWSNMEDTKGRGGAGGVGIRGDL